LKLTENLRKIMELAATGSCASVICDILHLDKSYVSRTLDKLAKEHYLQVDITGRVKLYRPGPLMVDVGQLTNSPMGDARQIPPQGIKFNPDGKLVLVHSYYWRAWVTDTGRLGELRPDDFHFKNPNNASSPTATFQLHTSYGRVSIRIHYRHDMRHTVMIHLPSFKTRNIKAELPEVEKQVRLAVKDWCRNNGIRFGCYGPSGYPEISYNGEPHTLLGLIDHRAELPDGAFIDFSPKGYAHDKSRPEAELKGPDSIEMAKRHQFPGPYIVNLEKHSESLERGIMMLADGQKAIRDDIGRLAASVDRLVGAMEEGFANPKRREKDAKDNIGGLYQ